MINCKTMYREAIQMKYQWVRMCVLTHYFLPGSRMGRSNLLMISAGYIHISQHRRDVAGRCMAKNVVNESQVETFHENRPQRQFFGISVDEKPSRLLGFTYGERRYRWNRLPQGWKWSMIIFYERIAEIVNGISCLQYADNVLIAAESLEELRLIGHQVLRVLMSMKSR